ncbi:class IIb bacteriocin, lactobin A/cerein 7B family [Chryseobacterium sp. RRHN12]|uniref:class IIb bacteriocin, lactobin A/cerein 7B family n=1 Tax=Chryseobacterium sp. RRHN12 TaxID=3437884 RepID=UPI002FCC63DD
MKKSNIQKRKLTKNELKDINGGNGPIVCPEGLCDRGDGEYVIGPVGRNGYCC